MASNFSLKNKGFSLIEALIGITIGALMLGTFSTLLVQTIRVNRVNGMNLKAMMYLQEEIEVAKDMEQSATSTIFTEPSACTNCHPVVNGTEWAFAPGPETIDGFTRSMTIGPVSRYPASSPNANKIETPYNPLDDSTSTKIATATISWYDGSQQHTENLETYLYYYGQ